jgi:conjugal transfer mating pair stabilization protein TraG
MKRLLALLAFLAVSLAAKAAFALDMEYYTYGGFEQIVGAFSKIALIFSDSGFKAAIFVAMVIGILFGGIALVMRAVGGRFSTLSWGVPLMAGYLVYAAMIVPQGNLYIYDPVANRNQAVGGIPDGIVFVAGTMNTIERFVVDTIYTTSTDPMSYQNDAGGRAFNLMYDMAQAGGIQVDADIAASLKQYTNDCVLFELQRPGTTLTVNSLATSTDFTTQYALAASPSVYTVEYPGDTTASCQAAWAVLVSQLTGGTMFTNAIKDACSSAGYNASNAQELAQCTDTLAGVVNILAGGTGYATSDVFKQMLIGQTMNEVLLDNSPSLAMRVLANRNTGSSLIGAGMAANEWLPVFKAVMTAVGLTLIPFLVIFLPTPLAQKALYLICGIFVYITAWGVIDAIIHSMAMDYAMTTLSGIITQGQLGMLSLNFFSTGPAQVLAVMGGMRWGGMMLAGAVSAAFVGAGGSALGHVMGSVTGTAQHAGSSAGMTVGTPEGMAKQLNATEMAPVTIANAAKFRYEDRVNAGMAQKFGTTESGMEMVGAFGAGGAAAVYRQMNTGKAVRFGAGGAAAENMGLTSAYSANTFGAGAQLGEASNLQTMFGNDAQSLANTRTAPQQAFNDTAAARGMKPEDLALTLATKDVVANVDTIMKYVQARGGISPHQAAGELGEIAASQNYVNAASYDKAREITGEEGQIRTRTNENLNEAAKFAVLSKFAQGLGLAKDDNDFKAMYDYHKMHHGEDSLTLSNAGAVSVLNQHMKDMGYSTHFKAGDRIRMNFDDQGNLVSAFAVRGASRQVDDVTQVMKGYQGAYMNRTETDNFRYKGEDGMSYVGHAVQLGNGVTTFDGAVVGADGREYQGAAKFVNGKPVYTVFSGGKEGEVVEKYLVPTGRTGKDGKPALGSDGKPETTTQWGVSTYRYSSDGKNLAVLNSNTLSTAEVNKNGFATTIQSQGGRVLNEDAVKGQSVAENHSYKIDKRVEVEVSMGSAFFNGRDLTGVTNTERMALITAAGFDYGTQKASQGLSLYGGIKGMRKGAGQLPTGASGGPTNAERDEWKIYYERLRKSADPGSAPPAMPSSPRITLRPSE